MSGIETSGSSWAGVRWLLPSHPLMNRVRTTCARGPFGQGGASDSDKWHFRNFLGFVRYLPRGRRDERLRRWEDKERSRREQSKRRKYQRDGIQIKARLSPPPPFASGQLSRDFPPRRRAAGRVRAVMDVLWGWAGDKVRRGPPMTVLAGGAAGASSPCFPA